MFSEFWHFTINMVLLRLGKITKYAFIERRFRSGRKFFLLEADLVI